MKTSRVLVLTALALGVSSAFAATDDFNRTTLGPDWVVQAGNMSISAGMVVGDDSSLMTYTPGAGNTSASIDIFLNGSTDLQYGALVLGYLGNGQNAFIKLQAQNDKVGFTNYGFYYGNNSFDGLFGNLTGLESVTSARLTASLVGSVATLGIDTNFDGVAEQTFAFDYGARTLGTGVGLGIYGPASLDNFSTPAIPEPETYALMLFGLAALGAMARRRQA